MAGFFIHRPIFAWVIALFIVVAGLLSLYQLPVAYYPPVAPPAISITATYPGASAAMVDQSVVSIIENELNGVDGLLYMASSSESNGKGQIVLTFEPGTDPALAQVDVQNQLARATPRLPQLVNQQGIVVDKTNANILMVVALSSANPGINETDLGDYASRYVLPELQRIDGVGAIGMFGTEYAMRIWLNMDKLISLNLTPDDINQAISAQNKQISAGAIGALPNIESQSITATIVVKGQLGSVEEFNNIIIRANIDGSMVRLGDVARVEIGAKSYAFTTRTGNYPTIGMAVQPAPGSNAVETARRVKAKLIELQQYFPDGVQHQIPLDTSIFINISINKVFQTLLEAIGLVFIVMLLFLQNLRYTLIPLIIVPVALLGTLGALLALGFSINVLTMFAMVLVIGILVDDAIVVVENVERLMAEEKLSPLDATTKAMGQITGAIVGITVVLVSVFIPMAFFSGSVGNIYRQFSVTMVVSILFSAFLAMSLTPALCATMLKPYKASHDAQKARWFGWFNRLFNRSAQGYERWVGAVVHRAGRFLLLYAVIIGAVIWLMIRLPTSFLPSEDQGQIFVVTQLPAGATVQRSLEVVNDIDGYFNAQPEVESLVSVVGMNFFGTGQNMANTFVTLKSWDQRQGEQHSADAVVRRAAIDLAANREAMILSINPPSIPELGTGSGFNLRLQDRGNLGQAQLMGAANQLSSLALAQPAIGTVRIESVNDAPQLEIVIDRNKAYALGVTFSELDSTLSTALGSRYVNDFPNDERMQRVIVQSDAAFRMQAAQLLELQLRNKQGDMVPLSTFASIQWQLGPVLKVRYNGYPAIRMAGTAAAGFSTGEAMAAIEQLMSQLPPRVSLEWHAISREEKASNKQLPLLLALSLLAVFLSLAALYESWTVPFAVLCVVPLGVLGSLLGATIAGLENDVYFKVGLITIIGLSAKNAVLIIEFARSLQQRGLGLKEATLTACRQRYRPILMTSMAFTLGVLPLVLASGAGSAGQRAVGTGVMGGMISATLLAIFLVPVFFMVIRRLFAKSPS
jgi:multidrug efflux pump